jgi:hypothetical protein
MKLKIQVKFTHDNDTDTVFLGISDTGVQEKLKFSGDAMLTTFDTSVPVSIAALNIIAPLILIQYVWAVWEFSEAQQYDVQESGELPNSDMYRESELHSEFEEHLGIRLWPHECCPDLRKRGLGLVPTEVKITSPRCLDRCIRTSSSV